METHMNGVRAVGLVAGIAAALVATSAQALWLDIRAKGEIDQFYDESGLFGFGVIDSNQQSPLLGKRATMRMILNLDLAPAADLSVPGHGIYVYDSLAYQPTWVAFSGSILGRRMREYPLAGADPYHIGYATIFDGTPDVSGREIADYGLEGGLRIGCATDPTCSGAYETYASAAIQVGSTGLNFLDGLGLDQEFRWSGLGEEPYGLAEFWFGKKFRSCDGNDQCVTSQLRTEGTFQIRSLVVRLRENPLPEPNPLLAFAFGLACLGWRRSRAP
jgi:hypothetical protein